MENSSTAKKSYTGYIGVLYRQHVAEGLRAGLPVQEVIALAQERIECIPHIQIDDFENPLAGDYLDSQRERG